MNKKWLAGVIVIIAAVVILVAVRGLIPEAEDDVVSGESIASEVSGDGDTSGTSQASVSSSGDAVAADTAESAAGAESGDSTQTAAATALQPSDEHIRDNDALYANQDDTSIVYMYLTVSTGTAEEGTNHTWEEINTYSADDYDEMGVDKYQVEGLLQVGDENGPVEGDLGYGVTAPNATVQIRGQSSTKNSLKNYKVKLKKDMGEWEDQRTINLNKHQGDGIRFRNKLGFDMLRKIPQLTSLRTQFVHLYVKDLTEGGSGEFEDYGLYTHVEQLNTRALKARGLDKDGQLYKVNYFEFYRYEDAIKLTTDPDYDQSKFEEYLEIKGSDDHSKLIDMLEDVNDESIPIEDVIAEHFDMENLTYWLAFNLLTGNTDTQSRNCFLYSPTTTSTWYFLSWDLDGMMHYGEEQVAGAHQRYTSWMRGVSNYWGNVLFRRCLQSATFRENLQTAIDDISENDLTESTVKEMADAYSAVVEPLVYAYADQYKPLTEEEYNEVVEGLPELIAFYKENYQESLERPMPFYIGTPVIEGTQMTINWAASYDFDNEALTYTAKIATDPQIENVVFTYTGEDLSTALEAPDPGQYYLNVTVTNESGNTQDAFDVVQIDEVTRAYGVKAFYISEDGTVTAGVAEQ